MINMFAHNLTAYNSAIKMLDAKGKAAIIHPTGTGKSFIAFKLCEDNCNKRILWLSPSEYIFKTQIENLKTVSKGYAPENIIFYTYAKLMYLRKDEIAAIKPDYIILDEFHRCGAQMWGKGVQTVLSLYSTVPVLGLSATNIRYLDNQRDMADELFDGNIASEMTLGEAIVRGILNPPKYVLSVFQYQKDLDKYADRVRRAKSKAVRDKAENYLEALRRALDKADGLSEIFKKHIPNKNGKYIVFCANIDHMDEMISHVNEWFGDIDNRPHIYKAYSDDPETSNAFENFKKDDSEHLKLLYCIDMLNEGVHVEDISGVILLRLTVSPIIYKQQIGRALSASKTTNAVIFDIVMNIDNLYSIGAIQDEMQVVMTYYREHWLENEIVNSSFKIVDEVYDCVTLFEKLNDTLVASWDHMFEEAKKYYQQYGNLEVPKRYKTSQGYSLGSWLATQRKVRKGEQFGILDKDRIDKLDGIGMIWDNHKDLLWNKYYAAAKAYFAEHGDLKVPAQYEKNGVKLGAWIVNLRTYRKNGVQSNYLTEERIASLNTLGMLWDVLDTLWLRNYRAAKTYYEQHGNLEVPTGYVSADGIEL
ncbi:MAG: Helicase associated domain protein, partial [Clostridiales bacterium]|nr:Helicase associated domain protein [Clostridiales bacterium]